MQRTANATDANHKHFDNLIGIEQHLMSNAHASGRIIVIYHGNRAFGRALSNRNNIDIRARQSREEFC